MLDVLSERVIEREENVRLSNDNEKFDTCLTASDWRYSAAIVGPVQIF